MNNIPWKELIELLRFWGYIALGITFMKLCMVMLTEVFGRFCKGCGKKV